MTEAAALPILAARASGTRVLVVHNPTAGRRRRRRVEQLVAELQRLSCDVEVYATRAAGDATRWLRQENRSGFEVVVAAGGDGTVNEVVNGLRSDEALAILPLGTVNVLVRELGLPSTPGSVAAAVARGEGATVFPGRIVDSGRRFLMMVGIGFDAWVVGGVDLSLKRRIGRLAYAVALFAQLSRYGETEYRFEVDGEEHRGYAAIVSRIRLYGGSFVLSTQAGLERRDLRVVIFVRKGLLSLLRILMAFVVGRLDRSPAVTALSAREIAVHGPSGETTQIDGDVGEVLPIALAVEECAVRIVGYHGGEG